MLHKTTVKPGTLDLISTLMQDEQLNSFYLVGGTALALRMGHRDSIDIDMFTSSNFNGEDMAIYLQKEYGAQIRNEKNNYVSGRIRDVDFDFITHNYPSVRPLEVIEGIRILSNEDIAAMKINAIVNNGTRLKDFIDIHYLLKEFSYQNIVDFYCQKYPNVNADMAKASLLYHNDIKLDVTVGLKDQNLTWEMMAKNIISTIQAHDKSLKNQQKQEEQQKKALGKSQGRDRGLGI